MNFDSSKIIQIKDAIKEIRGDIKEMEKKNDMKIKSFMTSISPYQSQSQSHGFSQSQSQYELESQLQSSSLLENNTSGKMNDDATRELINKYNSNLNENENDQLLLSSFLPNQNTHCLNSSLSSSMCHLNNCNCNRQEQPNNAYTNNYTYTYSNTKGTMYDDEYNNDEAQLRKCLSALEAQNCFLTNSLNEKRTENSILLQRKGRDDTYSTIQYLLDGSTIEEIIQKIDQMQTGTNESSIRNELIAKMKSLYIALTGTNNEKEVDIKLIWRWIKHLIRTVKEMANEKENTLHLINNVNDSLAYRDFCVSLIEDNGLGSIAELQGFIKELYAKANIGEKRIDKLKKVLFLSPQLKSKERTIGHKEDIITPM